MECETCGFEILLTKAEAENLPDFVECSTCAGDRRLEYRLKKLKEYHRPRLVDDNGKPIRIPPMMHIDTKDLPGFVRDDLAKNIGQTLSLFKDK